MSGPKVSPTHSLERRDLLRGACAGLSGLLSPRIGRAAPARPNIIFVLTDDLRWDGLGVTGHPFAQTPNLDRVGREGAVFQNFFVTTPLCSPSRASYLTGNYAHSHRIINNDKNGLADISHTLVSWPRLLRESGYETAFVGKWHMGFDDSRRPGFDDWVSFKAQGLFVDPVVNENGRRRQLSGYMTDYLNTKATEFVRRRRDNPFVLYLSHKAVHYPYLPAKRHERLYEDASIRYPEVAPHDLEGKPALTRKAPGIDVLRLEGHTPEPQEPRRGRGRDRDSIVLDQMRCMASVDDGIGMLLQALEDTGELDNTLIMFGSDNGYLLGEHGQFNQKRWAYEDSVRAPFLIRYPRLIRPGSEIPQMTLNIDVAPSMLELAGVRWDEELHGRSFWPLFSDPQAPWRESILMEYFVEKVATRCPEWQAVRTDRWKYIHYPALADMDELYDLRSDAREERNLINEAGAASQLSGLRRELARQLKQTR